MKNLLDSSTCIALLRGKPQIVTKRFLAADSSELLLCSIVVAELLVGALRSAHPEAEAAKVKEFVAGFPMLGFGIAEAETYARVRHDLERAGMSIGANDLIIAATAVASGLTLVTHNTREFGRVAGLQVEDWEA